MAFVAVACGTSSGERGADTSAVTSATTGTGGQGGEGGHGGASTSSTGGSGGAGVKTLGMNDVTMLVPLAATSSLFKATDLAADNMPLVPQALFDQLNKNSMGQNDTFETLDKFVITAVRFDACDRIQPGDCPPNSDGRLRLVLQPLEPMVGARDMGLHAFYVIPSADMATLASDLRKLAALQKEPISSPLKVSPALSADPSGMYAIALRQIISARAGASRLMRLTFLAQPDINAAIMWVVRGVEDTGSGFMPIMIPGINAPGEQAILVNTNSYQVTPLVDAPWGIALAWQEKDFAMAGATAQADALAALASLENPMLNTPNSLQCMTCHTSTLLTAVRSATAGIDPKTLPGRFTSSYDLSIDAGKSATNPFFVRGLGWRGTEPLISQRAANETAHALAEIEARFPPQ